MSALRVFFALWPDGDVRDRLREIARAIAERAQGRPPPPENLHMTLAFVGEVPEPSIAALQRIGRAAAATVPPFALTLDRIGTFPRQGIAWAGASLPPDALMRLAAELAHELTAQGYRLERHPFHAHVTLARRCRVRAADPIRPGEVLSAPIIWNVVRATLIASELVSGPPRYRELDGWPLAADGRRS